MLFSSYEFIFLFLPVTLIVFYLVSARIRVGFLWLTIASLFFYSWWNPAYLWLMLFSISFNYATGLYLQRLRPRSARAAWWVLAAGVLVNVGLLGYFKYANFLVGAVNQAVGTNWTVAKIILPLAISFYTFQQIAYLVDIYRQKAQEHNFLHYCLFVTFFPQLIAGPIVHHREMMDQFDKPGMFRFSTNNMAVGLTIFAIGLFKKVVIADGIAAHANMVFGLAEKGVTLGFLEAWSGVLAFSMQIYFDFSGYSDMAIGLARLFGIRLPLNFNSPYKSTSIVEFWRGWHMTLTRFLNEYVFTTLNKRWKRRGGSHVNAMTTMVIGGIWHGAGWNFLIFGFLNGFALLVNHGWRVFRRRILGQNLAHSSRAGRLVSMLLTYTTAIFIFVFFRSVNLDSAVGVLSGMLALGDVGEHKVGSDIWTALIALHLLVWLAPNTYQIMRNYEPALDKSIYVRRDERITPMFRRIVWAPSRRWAIAAGIMGAIAIVMLVRPNEFIYFQF